jgi:imidazolonepropionase-like amidohydrolase
MTKLLLVLATLSPQVQKYVSVTAPRVILEHVEIVDGTGAAPMADQNITIENGKITAISPGADQPPADGTTVRNLRGYTVMPGIVGMHNHLYYLTRPSDAPALALQMSFSAPRLYLANGVTTMRTAGSVEPYQDVRLKYSI